MHHFYIHAIDENCPMHHFYLSWFQLLTIEFSFDTQLLLLQTIQSITKSSGHRHNSKGALARSYKIHSIARNIAKNTMARTKQTSTKSTGGEVSKEAARNQGSTQVYTINCWRTKAAPL
jgi:hypothetical protein